MTNSALLVGINEYEDGNNLRGCCNDVDNIYSILVDTLKLFKPYEITILKNKQATRDNIVGYLRESVDKLRETSLFFFGQSSHGSQVVDEDGDEVDYKDEIICPYDMDWGKKCYITDDDLYKIFSKVPDGAWAEVLLDSCHSGTATRSMSSPGLPKTVLSPYAGKKLPVRRMNRSVEKVRNHALWAGCADNQYSSDAYIDGKFQGAFSYFWAEALRDNPKILHHKLLEKVRSGLLRAGFDQIPQLTIP